MARSLLGFSKRSRDCWKHLIANSFMTKIVIRNLTKTYGGGAVEALKNINFEVQPNESLCILGPSGCGKTTLLRIIDCLIARDQGEVLIDGVPVTQPRPDVTMVFQHFGLFRGSGWRKTLRTAWNSGESQERRRLRPLNVISNS